MPYVIGVDLGGTKCTVGAMSADGARQFAFQTDLTRAGDGADAVTTRMAQMVESVITQIGRAHV